MGSDCQRNEKKLIKGEKHSKKWERFEPMSLKVLFNLFSNCFKSCIFRSYLRHIYQVVLILATILGKNLSANKNLNSRDC